MNIIQLAAVSVCVSVLALTVKNIKSEMGQLISIAATVLVMSAVIPYIITVISTIREFAALSQLGERFLTPILKITGIAYISQIGAELCADSGEKALASRVEAAGKIAVTVIALPVAKEAFVKIMGILS
jgi:stage III sporulation protein AD